MAFEGRIVDLGDQIYCAGWFFFLAASRWWQAVVHGRTGSICIPPNKVRSRSEEQVSSGQILLCVVNSHLAVELPWTEPKTAVTKATTRSLNKVCLSVFYYCQYTLYLPPLARGGSSEFDGGSAFMVRWSETSCGISISGEATFLLVSIHGGVEQGRYAADLGLGIRRRWSCDTEERATISAAVDCQPTQTALWWPLSSPATVPGDSSTSRWRPSTEPMAEFFIFSVSSGDVPDVVEDCRPLCSWCDGGGRGSDRIFPSQFRVFFVISEDLSVFPYFHKVLAIYVPVPLN